MSMRLLFAACGVLIMGCSISDLLDVKRPDGIVDPHALKNSSGALLLYGGAIDQFAGAFSSDRGPSYTGTSGLLADELHGGDVMVDSRMLSEGDPSLGGSSFDPLYSDLQNGRIRDQQAIGALQKYGRALPSALIGQLFALDGYTEVMLGEAYCSGVPLSSAPYGGDIVYGTSLTTDQLFQHSLAQFDSAVVYSLDSTRILNMARVGRGRALLNLGKFADASSAVSEVPTNFAYLVAYSTTNGRSNSFGSPFLIGYTVADREGRNGLDFVSAGDRRVLTEARIDDNGVSYLQPLKYPDPTSPVVLADGIEARLIEAEAALKAGDVAAWAAKLNDLRTTAITPKIPALRADSTTSATADLRLSVMFRERAFWLFLTGHRLGDMRRLIRQYVRNQNSVFPIGIYDAVSSYGNDVNAPVPTAEEKYNPNFTGCFNRGA